VLLITHDPVALEFADYVVRLEDGAVVSSEVDLETPLPMAHLRNER